YLVDGHVTGAPPFLIDGLRKAAYAPLAEVLRESMRHSCAIRLRGISHWLAPVLTLDDKSLDQSVVLHEPIDEILGIIALESHRDFTMVILDSDEILDDDGVDLTAILKEWDIFPQQDVFSNEPDEIETRLSEEHGQLEKCLLELAQPTLSPL